jgi:gliding motility-associated-like protein
MKKLYSGSAFLLFFFAGFINSLYGREAGLDFIENRKQWPGQVRYKADVPGGNLFLTGEGLLFSYYSAEDLDRIHHKEDRHEDLSNEVIHGHAYHVRFIGADTNAAFLGESKRSYYHNYFYGNDPSKWAGNVPLYGKLVRQQVYRGIDLAVYSKGDNLKYDFIVAPGADPGQIQLEFDGVQPVLNSDGSLTIRTSVNEVTEQAPYTYQIIDGREVPVRSAYIWKKGRLGFSLPDGYNRDYPLIIDPVLVFSTYSNGVSSAFYSYSTTYDNLGNLYVGIRAFGPGLPVTTGAFQMTTTSNNSLQDVGIQKISSDGSTLIYCTYYGGSSHEEPNSIIVNSNNEVIVVGRTTSSNLPVTQGCYDNTLNGAGDIFVARFNAAGSALLGATYVGGSGNEAFTAATNSVNKMNTCEVAVSAQGNICVVSVTNSPDFPIAGTAAQGSFGGTNDGCIVLLNPDCSQLLYGSYLGGSGQDACYGLEFNAQGQAVVVGATGSADFPTTSGVLRQVAPGGTVDGFISIIDFNTGLVNSSYLGTIAPDYAFRCQIDDDGSIFVLGRTTGDYPISNGVYAINQGDVFIDKLTPDLSTSLLSTRVGNLTTQGTRYIPTAFLLDECGNIYVAGLSATAALPVTQDAYDASAKQFWFCVLTRDFEDLLYATFFGTTVDHSHDGVHRFDPQGVVYHSLCSNSGAFPTTPGVFAPAKRNVGQDCLSFKFDFEATGVRADFDIGGITVSRDTGCAPYVADFGNRSVMAVSYFWDFGDGTSSTDASPTKTYTTPGVYVVRLFAHNENTCVTDDTATRTIVVLAQPQIVASPDVTTCVNNPVQLDATVTVHPGTNYTVAWTPATGLNNATIEDPIASPLSDITYQVVVTAAGGCKDTDEVNIIVVQGFDLLTPDTAICLGDTVHIRGSGDSRYTYAWRPTDGVSNPNILTPDIAPDSSGYYSVTATHPGCRDSVRTIFIDVQPVPTVDLGADQILCYGDTFRLRPDISPDYDQYTYTWNPGGGLAPGPNVREPLYTGYQTTTLTLTVSTPAGCLGSDDILLEVIPPDIITASNDTAICPGDTIQLIVTGTQVKQVWRPDYYISDTLAADPYVYPVNSVTYVVVGTDIYNCTDTETVHVRVLPRAVVELPDSARIYPGETYLMEPGGNCLYFEWFPPLGLSDHRIANPVAQPEVNTRYFVTGRTENGCMATDSIDLYVNLDSYVDMPNAFVPGMGRNNLLRPVRNGDVTLKSFAIYNRWGIKMFETSDVNDGWDGQYNGQPQPMGVYVYVVEVVTPAGRNFYKQGNVTLLR